MNKREALALLIPRIAEVRAGAFAPQAAMLDSKARVRLAGAAVRTGKTEGAGWGFVDFMLDDYSKLAWGEEREYWVIAPKYEQNRAQKKVLLKYFPKMLMGIKNPLIDWARQGDKNQFFDETRGGGVLCLIGGVTIICRSADNPEGLVAERLRGVWWTEIARSKRLAWPNVQSRLANYSDSWLIADTSPMGRCWFYKDVWEPARRGEMPEAETFEWQAVDSPYIPPEKIEEARRSMPPEFFKREYEASWDAFQGQIFSMWDRKIHVRPCPFKPTSSIVSSDINTTTESPAATGLYLRNGNRVHLAWEYYEPIGLNYDGYAATIASICQRAKTLAPLEKLIIDPSFHRDFKAKLRAQGLDPHNGKNDVLDGIRTLGAAMMVRPEHGCPLFTVDPTCKAFPEEVEGYAWKSNSAGVIMDEPDKAAPDHLLDCARYLAMHVWSGFAASKQVR